MSWLSQFLGLDAPKPPDLSGSANELYGISDQIQNMFTPEQRAQLLGSTRQTGTRQIGQATSAANRAVGSAAGASGLYGSSPQVQAIQGNYAGASNALVGLEGELARLGMNFDAQQMQSLMAAAGIRGQGDALRQQGFQNQLAYDQASDPLGNILGLGLGAASIGALGGFKGLGGLLGGIGGLFGGDGTSGGNTASGTSGGNPSGFYNQLGVGMGGPL